MNRTLCLAMFFLFCALAPTQLRAASTNTLSVPVNGRNILVYRLLGLEDAKAEAKQKNKPIVWIASAIESLQSPRPMKGTSPSAATSHAFAAFADRAVIVWLDAFGDNHHGPTIVDDALHTPDPHYTPPGVVLTDNDIKRVIANIPYQKDFEGRKSAFRNAILAAAKSS